MTRKLALLPYVLATAFAVIAAGPAAGAGLEILQQAGGEPGSAVAVGGHLYQALGPSIVTSTNGAGAPAVESISVPLPGLVVGLAHSGSHLYALVRSSYPNGTLAVFSLADPAQPALIAIEDYSDLAISSPSALIVSGSRLYLADLEIGILAVDISNPADPAFTVAYSDVLPADAMTLTGGRLVVWGRSFFGNLLVNVFDLSNPTALTSLGSFDAGLTLGGGADGTFFYAIGFGLEIFDFSNLSNVQSVFQDGDATSRGVLLRSGRLYFGNADGLHVWDVSTPASATEIAVVPAPLDRAEKSAVIAVGADPKLVFFTQASRGLRFSAASTPSLEHTWNLPGAADATGLVDRGDHLFAADFYSGLRTLDRADLDATGRLDVPADQLAAVEGIDVAGNRVYIANWGFGLLIGDLTNPAAPTLLGSVQIDFATGVEVVGNYAYVVTSTNGGILFTVDVSNPASPQVIASAPTTKGMEIQHHNGLLLVADEAFGDPGGLRIFSLANPLAPAQVSHYTGCDSAAGVDAQGTRAYLACSDGSLHIVSIANPASPVQLGVYQDPSLFGDARDVAVRGTHAYLGRGDVVDAVSVANPASPILESRAELGFAVRRIALAASGQPWVAAGPAGIYQLEVGLFADGFESGNTSAWFSTVP